MNSEVDMVYDVAAAQPLMAGDIEARDRRGIVRAGASVSVVARRYDVTANQLFAWRKLHRTDGGAQAGSSGPILFPVTVTAEPEAPLALTSRAAETIEIELGDHYRIRVGSGVDGQALRQVPDAPERR